MRIIAGSAKGRSLKAPSRDSSIRPILGRIKQSLFDSIRPKIMGSHFLDLYAGAGTVGLEAASRGASFVVFVENGREGLKLIAANVEKLGFKEKTLIYKADVLGNALLMLPARLPAEFLFDLVFVAPPYMGEDRRGEVLVMSVPTLERLAESKLLAPDAWVILQHHKKESWGVVPKQFQVFKQAQFGESMLTYLKSVSL